jgi:DNA-binding MarR family transcriptional regulator
MFKWLSRLALIVAPLGVLVRMVVKKRGARTSPDATKILKYLATHTSAPVPELSSRNNLPPNDTSRLLVDLEQRGFVQLSAEQGIEHVRIAAITRAGREQLNQG